MVYILTTLESRSDEIISCCNWVDLKAETGYSFDKRMASKASVIFSDSSFKEELQPFRTKTVIVLQPFEKIRALMEEYLFDKFVFDYTDHRQVLLYLTLLEERETSTSRRVEEDVNDELKSRLLGHCQRFYSDEEGTTIDFRDGTFNIRGDSVYLTEFQKLVIFKRINLMKLNPSERVTMSYLTKRYNVDLRIGRVKDVLGCRSKSSPGLSRGREDNVH